jgi:chaperonin cofactor prefoldin
MQYYIKINDKAFGSFDENELIEMKTKGKLCRTSEISENRSDWFPATELEFLFPAQSVLPTKNEVTHQPASSEPSDWFYTVNGQEGFGPVTASAIRQMILSGTLRAESLVWQPEQNAQPISSIQEFDGYVPLQSEQSTPPSGFRNKMMYAVIAVTLLIVVVVGAVFIYKINAGKTDATSTDETVTDADEIRKKAEAEWGVVKQSADIETMPPDDGSNFILQYEETFGDDVESAFKRFRDFAAKRNFECEQFVKNYDRNDIIRRITAIQCMYDQVANQIYQEWYGSREDNMYEETLRIFAKENTKNKVYSNLDKCTTLLEYHIKKLNKKEKENTLKLFAMLSQYRDMVINHDGTYQTFLRNKRSLSNEFSKTLGMAKLEW